eukprot:4843964-Lingulodinium_polyedra.AAC.1
MLSVAFVFLPPEVKSSASLRSGNYLTAWHNRAPWQPPTLKLAARAAPFPSLESDYPGGGSRAHLSNGAFPRLSPGMELLASWLGI